MKTLTIPSNLVREKDLVLIPRRDYEGLLAVSEEKSVRDPKIDRELAISMKEYKEGKVGGPFATVEEFVNSLKPSYRRKNQNQMRFTRTNYFGQTIVKAINL